MVALYVVALIVGGALIVMSAFGAEHGHGGDAGGEFHVGDVHADVTADHEAHFDAHGHDGDHQGSESWLPFLSLRFWTYLFAVGGAIGLLLTYFGGGIQEPAIAATSGGTGFVAGLLVAYAMRAIRKYESDSSTKERDLLGQWAKVTVAIRDGQPGKVRCEVKGETIDLLALPEGSDDVPIGSEVVIVGIEDGRARVVLKDAVLNDI